MSRPINPECSLCLCFAVHDEEPRQAPGVRGVCRRRGRHPAPPLLQGRRLAGPGAQEGQATLQAQDSEYPSFIHPLVNP